MKYRIFTVVVVSLLISATHGAEVEGELNSQVDELQLQLQALEQRIEQLSSGIDTQESAIRGESGDSTPGTPLVNLEAHEITSIDDQDGSNVLSNPWWRNFDISGFAAAGYYDTGSAGTRDKGGFEIKEATLFVTAEVWDDVEFFSELQTNRLGKDNDKFVRTGEVYLHFHSISLTDSITVGMKLGRIDIPFGDEYLWQDAIDNPLITNSAAYPYGWDEGILLYGDYRGVGWIAAITDGTDDRSVEENSDKAFNIKIYGSPLDALNLSFSAMANGDVSKSAIEFGGSHFRPVGAAHQSAAGISPSAEVGGNLMEVNAKYDFSLASKETYLALSLGSAKANDSDPIFDRDFRWFSIEPSVKLNQDWYATLRYSEIGTYDSNEGYHFDGKTFAGGNAAFGYDTKRFQRTSIGVGWAPNPHVRAKFEIAKDRFELIDVSPLTPSNGDRGFAGLEIAVGF